MSFRNTLADAFRYSMESEDETPEVVDVVESENADNVEAAVAEAEQVRSDIEGGLDAAEKAADDARTLERVAETLEETEEEGGATPAVAEMAEVAVESIYRYYNFRAAPVTSLEAFASRETRIKATRLSVEGIKDTARNLWERIKKFFADLWESVKAFFAKIFTAQGRLAERAKKLKDAATTKEGETSGEVSGGFITVLSPTKQVNAAQLTTTMGNLDVILGWMKEKLDAGENLANSLNREMLLAFASGVDKDGHGSEDTGVAELWDSFRGSKAKETFPAKKWLGLVDDDGHKWYGFGEQTGSYIPVIYGPVVSGNKVDISGLGSAKMQLRQVKDTADGDAKVPALTKSDCVSFCSDVVTSAAELKKVESRVDAYGNKAKTALNMMGGVEKELNDDSKYPHKGNVFALYRFILGCPTQAYTTLSSLYIKVASAGLDYVQKSLSAKDDKEDKKAKK